VLRNLLRAGALLCALMVGPLTQQHPDTAVPLGGLNESTKVDVRLVPVPLEGQYRGDATALVSFLAPVEIDDRCGTMPGKRVVACVDMIGGLTMALPNPCAAEFQGEDYASVVCHEKGHILGWEHEMASHFRKYREF